MESLKNKTAIITGGTSGIGEGIAKHFASCGARVVIGGRDVAKGRRVEAEIRAGGGSCVFVPGDVVDRKVNEELVQTALREFGRLDILAPCAGALGIGGVEDLSEDTWDEAIATNLSAVFYLCHYAIPAIRESGGGSIIVVSSIASFKVFPNHPAYCASKAGVTALVKQIALDYGPEIRANAICPGQVDTPLLWESTKAFEDPQRIVKETAESMPLKRIGRPSDIAKAAAFLASSDADWITGSPLVIDGGSLLI